MVVVVVVVAVVVVAVVVEVFYLNVVLHVELLNLQHLYVLVFHVLLKNLLNFYLE